MNGRSLWLFSFLYAILVGAFIQVVLLPYLMSSLHGGHGLLVGNDVLRFHSAAVELAQSISTYGWSHWSLRPEGQAPIGLMAAVYVFLPPVPLAVLPVYALFWATSALLLFNILSLCFPDKNLALFGTFIFVFFPSSALLYAMPHKDVFFVCGILFLVYGSVLVCGGYLLSAGKRYLAVLAYVAIACGFFLIYYVRPYSVKIAAAACFILLAVTLAVSLYKLFRGTCLARIFLKNLAYIFLMSLLLFVFVDNLGVPSQGIADTTPAGGGPAPAGGGPARSEWTPAAFLPAKVDGIVKDMIKVRYSWIRTYADMKSGIDLDVEFSNAGDVILYAPRAIAIGLFAPFPTQWGAESSMSSGRAMKFASALEMSIWYLSLAGIFVYRKYQRAKANYFSIFLVATFCLTLLLVYAIAIPNVGSLYRLRWPFLILLVSICCAPWGYILNNRRPSWTFGKSAR